MPGRSTSAPRALTVVPILVALGVHAAPAAAQARAPLRPAVPVRDAVVVGRLRERAIDEASALVRSAVAPQRWWTLNDSGGDAVLFAHDSTGAPLGALTLVNARNRDWEALAVGRCGAADAAPCLWVGDTGDNDMERKAVHLYRVREPAAVSPQSTARADRFVVRYEDGPRDVEAMVVGPDGAIHLFTKRDPAVRHYRIDPRTLVPADTAVARFVETLPITRSWIGGALVTDGALRPDRTAVALRTYTQVFVVPVDPATLRWTGQPVAVCDLGRVAGEERLHGEGISYLAAPDRLLLGAEGRGAPLHAVRCP